MVRNVKNTEYPLAALQCHLCFNPKASGQFIGGEKKKKKNIQMHLGTKVADAHGLERRYILSTVLLPLLFNQLERCLQFTYLGYVKTNILN